MRFCRCCAESGTRPRAWWIIAWMRSWCGKTFALLTTRRASGSPGDGEFDANGRLPTINIHYGGDNEHAQGERFCSKPWGVGETSMAYYGTPKQVSQFNGNRAYESPLGRMEGLAYECYGLLTSQQKYGADYQSVFNIAWYSVQPLPFGKSDLSMAPGSSRRDLSFGSFKEGVPGMQPERLGPYVSTLNPGYDSKLPLYRPWPMFEAIRDANKGVTNSPWAKASVQKPLANPAPIAAKTNGATLAFLPENGAALAQKLAKSGAKTAAYSGDAKTDFLLIDGSSEPNAMAVGTLKIAADKVLADGGTVWVWDIRPAAAAALSKVLDLEVSVAPRVASSFCVKQSDALLAGLDNATLYFSEGDDWQQISYALSGDFMKDAEVVLEACPVDWRRWSYRSEQVKTASIFRSQVENTGPLAAIAIRPVNKGRVILCNLNP